MVTFNDWLLELLRILAIRLADTKINELDLRRSRLASSNTNVVWLDVIMNVANWVNLLKKGYHLNTNLQNSLEWESIWIAVVHDVAKRWSELFHYKCWFILIYFHQLKLRKILIVPIVQSLDDLSFHLVDIFVAVDFAD